MVARIATNRFTPGLWVEQSLQLALTNVERSSVIEERVEDLLSAARSHLDQDSVRALYFANEAYTLANQEAKSDLELRALLVIITSLKRSGRANDATPFIGRAIELAPQSENRQSLDELLDLLGQWSIDLEQSPRNRGSKRRNQPEAPMGWIVAAISRLERERARLATLPVADTPGTETAPEERRQQLDLDDPETGLLNSRGLAAELLHLEQQRSQFALIQITVVPDDVPMAELARLAAETTGTGGILARNARSQVTIILPFYTGIAAMTLAEQLKQALTSLERAGDVTIGIGVALKQPQESARDVLRRVTDRAEEAVWQTGISVVG
jgi:GGDEF domain-containing protein